MIALYILAAIVAVLLILVAAAVIRTLLSPSKTTADCPVPDAARTEAYAGKLAEMVRFETVSSREDPQVEKFREFHKVLAKLYPLVFEKLEKIEIDGNLMMRWKGTDPATKPVILISHQDVVPAEGTWTYPPFSGTIADGKVWGRGSGDIKCGVMAFYQAAEELLAEGYVPKCDIYLGSSCTEEIGGDGAPKMAKWFRDRGIRLFMLCDEGGGIVQDPMSGIRGNFAAVGIFEKGYGDLTFTARSAGGHSSTPPRHTPIARLAAFEHYLDTHDPFKAKFSPAVEGMFTNLAPYCENFLLKTVMMNLWLFRPLLVRCMPAISSEAAAMLKTTFVFTMQQGSGAANVIPQEATVTANLRYIPHQSLEESNAIMTHIAARFGLETEATHDTPPSESLDLNGEAFRMTADTIAKVFPGIGLMPYVVTGGTDSRFFGGVCDNCVRFSPVRFSAAQMAAMHGIDENLDCDTLPPAVDYFKAIIRAQEGREQ